VRYELGVTLDADRCYQALSRRDARFDGAFFVGVTTTGIYCRPVCPARTPRRDRCLFFLRTDAAEQAGFRACFRCRPNAPRGSAPVDAVKRLVRDAAARIDRGFLDTHSVEELASELRVTSRHLRRAMDAELGLQPVALAQERRLARAKELVETTSLPLTEIAFAAGFRSIRRFNELFRKRFGHSPRGVRRTRARTSRG